MSKNTAQTSSQRKLTGFFTTTSNKTTARSGIRKKFEVSLDVLVNVKTKMGKKNTKIILEDDTILTAIDTAEEMNLEKMLPLTELGIEMPTQIELDIAKVYLDDIRERNDELNKLEGPKDKKIKTNALTELYKVRQGMENVYKLFAAIDTFPSGTAVCESSFSALTRIMRPQRVGMLTKRLNNLSFLAFEHKRLASVDLDIVLKKFNDLKNRKVQLF